MGLIVCSGDLIDKGTYARHNPQKLADLLVKLFEKLKEPASV